ncbi:conserved domain protein [Streptococcus oralis SK313]|uniref:Conserved domain protein n=1 Tax=Streptococcus oralis SK313 TaxID=1035190 RepID=F9Q4Z4_STROR|nr:conserved domain protein [Streptococcus oralis SK313]
MKPYYFDESKKTFKHCIGVKWLKVDGGWEYQGKKVQDKPSTGIEIQNVSIYINLL